MILIEQPPLLTIRRDFPRPAEELIAAGAQVNRLGWTPLHYAASRGRAQTARMLIAHGAIINAPGPDGTTPLMMAALSGNAEVVDLLRRNAARHPGTPRTNAPKRGNPTGTKTAR